VTSDPFGDFATRGYLRNFAKEKDLEIVRRLEHTSFVTGLEEAFAQLARAWHLSYENVLATHKTLFEAIYPLGGERSPTTWRDERPGRPSAIRAASVEARAQGRIGRIEAEQTTLPLTSPFA
jgi:fido (protein-threonine AMPylation protein)